MTRTNGVHMFDLQWSFNMRFLRSFGLSCSLLLAACGDDLSALPEPNQKVPGTEPDSFSFETATVIDVGSRTFSTTIVSTVPEMQTRYYQFTLGYSDVGATLGSLKDLSLVSADDSIELAWYDPDKNIQTTHASFLDLSIIESLFYTECCDQEFTFYVSVKNATASSIDYNLAFSFVDN